MQAQENAIGLPILYQVLDSAGNPRDITGFNTHELVFKKPNGTCITKAADFQNDGTDGILGYVTVSGDLNQSGAWQIQAHLANASFEGMTETAIFYVGRNVC